MYTKPSVLSGPSSENLARRNRCLKSFITIVKKKIFILLLMTRLMFGVCVFHPILASRYDGRGFMTYREEKLKVLFLPCPLAFSTCCEEHTVWGESNGFSVNGKNFSVYLSSPTATTNYIHVVSNTPTIILRRWPVCNVSCRRSQLHAVAYTTCAGRQRLSDTQCTYVCYYSVERGKNASSSEREKMRFRWRAVIFARGS